MGEYLVYGLVFAAIVIGLWVVWTMADAAGLAEGEKGISRTICARMGGRRRRWSVLCPPAGFSACS